MNAVIKSTLAALVLAGVAVAPAAASIQQDVRQAVIGSGQIGVHVSGDTATLFGYSDGLSRQAAERAALESDEVDRVINLVTTNGG